MWVGGHQLQVPSMLVAAAVEVLPVVVVGVLALWGPARWALGQVAQAVLSLEASQRQVVLVASQ